MPANLTPDYKAAEERFRTARSTEEKVSALEEMLARIPKHKGTEKLQADLRKRLSKLRVQEEKAGGGKRHSITVPREGCAQVLLLGSPNAGKSQVLASLTKAEPEVAPYPYTTQLPLPGMMHWENMQVQLVDMPPLSEEHMEGWVSSVLRSGDAALLVADAGSDGVLDDLESDLRILERMRIHAVRPEDRPSEEVPGHFHLRTMILAWQADRPEADERIALIRELHGSRFPLVAASALDEPALERLKRSLVEFLQVIRVYTQAPGKHPDRSHPFVIPHGTTVAELAEHIHKDLARELKYARVWGSAQFDGQRVQRDHVLEDGDVVELHG